MRNLFHTALCYIKYLLFAFLRQVKSKSEPVKTLYIIGNGFDIHHGLNTRYQTFAFYLQDHHSDIYDLLLKYFGLPDIDRNNKDDHWNVLWSELEKALADMDYQEVLDDNIDRMPDYASDSFRDRDRYDFQVEMESISTQLTTELFNAFKNFILAVDFPALTPDKQLNIDPNSKFLSFNYTDTLEQYYHVPEKDIVYIHGKAKTQGITLVLGHGVQPDSFNPKQPKMPEGLTDEEEQIWTDEQAEDYDYSYDLAQQEILGYYYNSFKKTNEIIEANAAFFDALAGTEKIVILGHSLAEVDHPYIKKVIQSISDCTVPWYVSYYSEKERESHLQRLRILGLHRLQIHLRRMQDI